MDQEKDMNVREQKKLSILSKRNAFSVFLIKKTDKIAAAVHLLSDFFPEQDPLRLELRSSSLQVLSRTLSSSHQKKEEAVVAIHALLSHLQVAYYAMRISEMNWLVLKRELEMVLSYLDSRFNREGESVLSTSFFEGESLPDAPALPLGAARPDPLITAPVYYQGQNKGQYKTVLKNQERISVNVPNNATYQTKEKPSIRPLKNLRKEDIVSFFKKTKNSDVSIKDITAVIKDCSEKTIQRELLALVEENVLKKSGERRWSRYALAQ